MSRLFSRPLLAVLGAVSLVIGVVAPAEAAEPTGTVRGTIHDEAGGLLVRDERKITVSLYRGDDAGAPALTTEVVTHAVHGGFEIGAVPAGRYSVKFEPRDSGLAGEWWGDTRRAAERAFIDVTADGTVELDVRLSSTALLWGTMTGRDTILPSSTTITATSGDAELDSWLPRRNSTSSMPGRYELRLLPGRYDVTFTDATGGNHPLTVSGVTVAAEPTEKNVVPAVSRGAITGDLSLRTASGVVPLDWGYVEPYTWSAADQEWVVAEQCGSTFHGEYFMDCLAAGRYKLSVLHDGATMFWGGDDLQSASEIVLTGNGTLTGIDVIVDAPAKVNGVVVMRSANGAVGPVSGAWVDVWRKTPAGGYVPVPGAVRGYTADGYTSGDGVFDAILPAGTYVFRAWTSAEETGATYLDGSRFFDDATEVTLGLGERRDLGTIVLPASSFEVQRIAGADRFATAIAVSKRIIHDGTRAPVVYLTNAYDFPDALAAGPAAMRAGGVVLPVAQTALPAAIEAELRRVRPQRVVLAGGTGVVSEAVRRAVQRVVPADATVVRLGGATRYETADLIVRDAFSAAGSRYAIIATGANYPDALAAGPAAGHLDAPVLLVNGRRGLDAATKATIARLGITDVYIAGGPAVVGAAIESGLRALLGTTHVERFAGGDRFVTAILINEEVFGSVDYAYIASARGFADALAGGPLAATQDAPLYLADSTCFDFYTLQGIRYRQAARVTLLGGTGVLGAGVAKLAQCR